MTIFTKVALQIACDVCRVWFGFGFFFSFRFVFVFTHEAFRRPPGVYKHTALQDDIRCFGIKLLENSLVQRDSALESRLCRRGGGCGGELSQEADVGRSWV